MQPSPSLNRTAREEQRVGIAFGRPVSATIKPEWNDKFFPGWGVLVTPDEYRYLASFGIDMSAHIDSTTFTDETLLYYTDTAIGILERDLDVDIIPRCIIYQDPVDTNTGNRIPRPVPQKDPETGKYIPIPTFTQGGIPVALQEIVDKMDEDQKLKYVDREPGYPYRSQYSRAYLMTIWRRRPTREIYSAQIVDPVQNSLVNIYQFRQDYLGLNGYSHFFPTQITTSAFVPLLSAKVYQFQYPFENFPQALFADYLSGYPKASVVPQDLREMVRLLGSILALNDLSDGILGPISSSSANLNSISESFTTILSAENTAFGAKTRMWQDVIKRWYKNNATKYRRPNLGAL